VRSGGGPHAENSSADLGLRVQDIFRAQKLLSF
jgi:hypothetical protein